MKSIMEKRVHSWKLKSSESSSTSNDSLESSSVHSTQHPDDQIVSEASSGQMWLSSDETRLIKWEDKLKHLNQKLSSALMGVSDKDELIRIHSTFAQAAVSGWKKAEAEAAILRQELDFTIQQKLATEDRVSHLDGSLKESKKQLRQVREEQEGNIHNAIAKNRREWENIHAELEEKLRDLQQKYVEKDAENKEISKSLQNRIAHIENISEAHSQAKAELNTLRTRLESMEKENANLKSNCTTILEEKHSVIIDEKKSLTKKSAKISQRQTLENSRKVSKVGRDKKLNCREKLEVGRSQDKKESNNSRITKYVEVSGEKTRDSTMRIVEKESLLVGRYTGVLQDRLSAMEEETRRLKELLEKKDNELLHARFLSEQMANKLSTMEKKPGPSYNQATLASNYDLVDDNYDSSSSLASTVITEKPYFREDKSIDLCTSKEHHAVHILCDLLISDLGNIEKELASSQCDKMGSNLENIEKLDVTSLPIDQMNLKVGSAQENTSCFQYQNVSAQERLRKFQEQLDTIFQVQDQGGDLEVVLNQARSIMGIDIGSSLISATYKLVETIKVLMRKSPSFSCKPCVHYWEDPEFDAKWRTLGKLCSIFLHGNMDIVKLLEDLSSSLEGLIKIECSKNDASLYPGKLDGLNDARIPETISLDEENECSFSDSNNVSYIENKIISNTIEITSIKEDLRKVQGEKIAFETHMRVESQRFHDLEENLAKVSDEKLEVDNKLKAANAELEQLKAKIFRFEQIEANLWAEFMSAKSSSQLIDEQLYGINSSSEASESQLKVILVEWSRLQYKVGVLERELRDKQEKNILLEANCQKFVDQLLRSSNVMCSKCQAVHIDGERAIKEEFATKSSKSWQSKLMLVKSLKALNLHHKGEQIKETHDNPNEDAISADRGASTHPEEDDDGDTVSSLFEVHLKNGPNRWRKYHGGAKKEMVWRHGSASDLLDWELANLSQSGRPLVELFGDRTPEHDRYIQAVEELPSSSDDEDSSSSPRHLKQTDTPLYQKKVDGRTKSMDAGIHNGTHNKSFSRLFFSKGKRFHS